MFIVIVLNHFIKIRCPENKGIREETEGKSSELLREPLKIRFFIIATGEGTIFFLTPQNNISHQR